jgi:hypothetical protein
MAETLFDYATEIVTRAGGTIIGGEIFAKVLTTNDDSGRHGVLIPGDAYSFFPYFEIPDPEANATITFTAFDSIAHRTVTLAYKYYQRYPERRITRLNGAINSPLDAARLIVFVRAKHSDGSIGYYVDAVCDAGSGHFQRLFQLIFGDEVSPSPGLFLIRPIEAPTFTIDADLADLLGRFDEIRQMGWIETQRIGDTGLGYTFESLLGIKENNDQTADYRGIEIKCKLEREKGVGRGKLNLFQAGPIWTQKMRNHERIRLLGQLNPDGLYACHSQVTTLPNNLELALQVVKDSQKIDLSKSARVVGYWPFEKLGARLAEKHSRAVVVKAKYQDTGTKREYLYNELVYCERPSIERFVDLVAHRRLVFEFTMSEKPGGRIRNHGYPWRLSGDHLLDQLFAFQIKLR